MLKKNKMIDPFPVDFRQVGWLIELSHYTNPWQDLIWNTVHLLGLHTIKRTNSYWRKFSIDLQEWYLV